MDAMDAIASSRVFRVDERSGAVAYGEFVWF
jgi:hypothetical protein